MGTKQEEPLNLLPHSSSQLISSSSSERACIKYKVEME